MGSPASAGRRLSINSISHRDFTESDYKHGNVRTYVDGLIASQLEAGEPPEISSDRRLLPLGPAPQSGSNQWPKLPAALANALITWMGHWDAVALGGTSHQLRDLISSLEFFRRIQRVAQTHQLRLAVKLEEDHLFYLQDQMADLADFAGASDDLIDQLGQGVAETERTLARAQARLAQVVKPVTLAQVLKPVTPDEELDILVALFSGGNNPLGELQALRTRLETDQRTTVATAELPLLAKHLPEGAELPDEMSPSEMIELIDSISTEFKDSLRFLLEDYLEREYAEPESSNQWPKLPTSVANLLITWIDHWDAIALGSTSVQLRDTVLSLNFFRQIQRVAPGHFWNRALADANARVDVLRNWSAGDPPVSARPKWQDDVDAVRAAENAGTQLLRAWRPSPEERAAILLPLFCGSYPLDSIYALRARMEIDQRPMVPAAELQEILDEPDEGMSPREVIEQIDVAFDRTLIQQLDDYLPVRIKVADSASSSPLSFQVTSPDDLD